MKRRWLFEILFTILVCAALDLEAWHVASEAALSTGIQYGSVPSGIVISHQLSLALFAFALAWTARKTFSFSAVAKVIPLGVVIEAVPYQIMIQHGFTPQNDQMLVYMIAFMGFGYLTYRFTRIINDVATGT